MTDDDLERALFALPLEEPPADLHGRILGATILRPAPTFRVWELWLLAGAVALVAVLTYFILHSPPLSGERLGESIESALRSCGFFSRWTYVWIGVGISSVWWISSLSFMPVRRVTVYDR